MIRYKKCRTLTAVVDICVPREQFRRDIAEAFGEIEKWREDRAYSPPNTSLSGNPRGKKVKVSPELDEDGALSNDFYTE
jgi:hypothetical protein